MDQELSVESASGSSLSPMSTPHPPSVVVTPQAYKFFIMQHFENIKKYYNQRNFRQTMFERNLAQLKLDPDSQLEMKEKFYEKEANYMRLQRKKIDKSMFEELKTIGIGSFGEVSLVSKTDANQLYAMKKLRKVDVLKWNQIAHVRSERDILSEADSEWIVKLYYSFQDKDNLYLVMDYVPGGNLKTLLRKLGIFQESLARFYIAELTCAIESVHNLGFIHRDLKPESILLGKDGHIKLAGFGLCTDFRWNHDPKYYQSNGEDRNNKCLAHTSSVETLSYIAPEVLLQRRYTQLSDWWSVGVILYEMVLGSLPFLANTILETQLKIIKWERTLHIPGDAILSSECTDMILKLCCGAEKRLGKTIKEIKAHPFLQSIDFEKELRTQPALYLPKIETKFDTSNFEIEPDKLRQFASMDSTESDGADSYFGFMEFSFTSFIDK